MAQIDMKNTVVKIKDGYAGPAGSTTPVLNNSKLADPVSAPTCAATGGGATGGLLAAGTYLVSYTFVTTAGETLNSPDSSTLTVGATNIPRVTLPALPTGATGINVYVSTPSGATGTETKYNATPIITTTYDLAIAQPSLGAKPGASTANLPYALGATVLTVAGIVGAVVTSDLVSIAGENSSGLPTEHKITAHSETSTNTTSITISPPLSAAVAGNAALTLLPHELLIKIGEGTLSWTEKRQYKYVTDRGRLSSVREEDQVPMEVKMDAIWEFIKGDVGDPNGGLPTIRDVLNRTGLASSWVNAASDPCEPYAVNIVVDYTPLCTGIKTEEIILRYFRHESFEADLKNGNFVISGKCNAQFPESLRQ